MPDPDLNPAGQGPDENRGRHEDTESTGVAGSQAMSLSRRSLLRTGAKVGLGASIGLPSLALADTHTEGFDPNSVRWTAHNRTLHRSNFNSQHPDERAWWGNAFFTNTQLQYINAEWEEYGNPRSEAEHSGAWRHTFMLTSYGIGMKPLLFRDTEPDDPDVEFDDVGPASEVDYIPAMPIGDIPRERLSELVDRHDVNPDDFIDMDGYPFPNTFNRNILETKSRMEITSNLSEDFIAISPRRDNNLFGFPDPSTLTNSFLTDDGLTVLNSHTKAPTFEHIRTAKPNDHVARTRRLLERESETQAVAASAFGLSIGVAGAVIGGSAALISAPAVAAGLTAYGLIKGTVGLLEATIDAWNGPEGTVPHHKGFFTEQVKPRKATTGCFVLFDVYVAPNTTPSFSIRVHHPVDSRTAYPPRHDNARYAAWDNNWNTKVMWEVSFDELGPDPDDESPVDRFAARIKRPESARQSMENYREHDIRYRGGSGALVTNKPEAAFSIDVPDGSYPPEVGQSVRFDPSNTMIGGAPIRKYEWRLSKIMRSFSTVGSSDPDRIPVTGESNARNIFDAPETGVFEFEPDQTGYYEMQFTVWDEQNTESGNGKHHTVEKTFFVLPAPSSGDESDGEAEGPDVSVTVSTASSTVPEGEPVTFEATANTVGDQPGHPIPAPDVSAPRYVYEWDVVNQSLPFEEAGNSRAVPEFDGPRSESMETYTRAFEIAGTYDVYVQATDVYNGVSDTDRVSIEVTREEDGTEGRNVLFSDDWEDGEYQSDPEWQFPSGFDNAVEVMERTTPDDGSHVVRFTDATDSAVNFISEPFGQAEQWQGPWLLRGLFYTSDIPGAAADDPACTYHDVWVGAGREVVFKLSAYDPYAESFEPIRIDGRTINQNQTAEGGITQGEWYRYEVRYDGDGNYTGTRWLANRSKSTGIEVTATGDPPPSPNSVLLYASGSSGGGLCSQTSATVVDHAFVEMKIPNSAGS